MEIELIRSVKLHVPETYTFGTFGNGQEHFFLTDVKNAKVIIFDKDGRVVCEYGEKGVGPKEFLGPRKIDSTNQQLLVGDYKRLGVHVLRVEKNIVSSHDFIKLDYVPDDVCFAGDKMVFLGYWSDGERAWWARGFHEKKGKKEPEPLITQEFVMGISDEESRKNGINYSSLGASNLCASAGTKLFTCWGGRMRVVSLDLKDRKLGEFGNTGKYFVTPQATEPLKNALLNGDYKRCMEMTKRMCRIESIAANEHYFYLTYRTGVLNKSIMSTILQQYRHDGVFMGELILSDSFSIKDVEWNYLVIDALSDKRVDQLYVHQMFEDNEGERTYLVHQVKVK
jgi:hypothetical protein